MVPATVRVLAVVLVVVLVVTLALKVVLRRRIQVLVAEDKVLKILHRRQNLATLLILLSLILVATLEATADLVTLAIAAVLTLLGGDTTTHNGQTFTQTSSGLYIPKH